MQGKCANSPALPASKAQETLASPHPTTFELALQLCQKLFGLTPYDGVRKLDRAADYCSNRMFGTPLDDPEQLLAYSQACLLLQKLSDQLDTECFERMCADVEAYDA